MESVLVDMQKVKMLAAKKLLTVAELARRANVSNATLYALHGETRKASFTTLMKIASVLDVAPKDLLRK